MSDPRYPHARPSGAHAAPAVLGHVIKYVTFFFLIFIKYVTLQAIDDFDFVFLEVKKIFLSVGQYTRYVIDVIIQSLVNKIG